MQEVKRELRKRLIARRKAMNAIEKSKADESIFAQVKPFLENAKAVLTYVSTGIEVDTRRILEFCFERGIPVAVPVSGDTELFFYEIRSFSELSEGRFGILEPVNRSEVFSVDGNTLCIVPALCADGSGARLGYGRGYYDRFLSRFNGKSIILCYSGFKMSVPAEPHDKCCDTTIFDI